MINRSLPSTTGSRKENVRYSRHLSLQHQRIYLNGRSQLIIHARVRSPSNNRCSLDDKSLDINCDLHSISTILTAHYRQSKLKKSDNISNPTDQTTLKATHSLNLNRDFQRHQSLPNTIDNNWNKNNLSRHFQDQNNKTNNSFGDDLQRQHSPSDSNKNHTNNSSSLFLDFISTTEKKELWSNTKDLQRDIKRNKKKKKRYPGICPCSCPCLLASLLAALLLGTAIAAALLAVFSKSQTTTTAAISTTISTTLTTATTQTTTSTTQTTTSTSQTTTCTSQTTTSTTQTTTSTTQTTTSTTQTTTSTTQTTTSTTQTTTSTSQTTTSTTQTTTSTTQTTTSTSQTTTSTTKTTTSTTQTTTSTSQTTTTVTTSTVSTTSTPTTTTTPISCNIPISSIFNYSGPTTQMATCTFTALSSGSAVLQFGFSSQGANKIGYLDDVSIVDTTASDSEMLINGGFENGTLVGWQQLSTSNCQSDAGSITSGTSCYTGSFCYMDGCKNGIDYLQQTFTTIVGHVYTLSFWLQVSGNQNVYVGIL